VDNVIYIGVRRVMLMYVMTDNRKLSEIIPRRGYFLEKDVDFGLLSLEREYDLMGFKKDNDFIEVVLIGDVFKKSKDDWFNRDYKFWFYLNKDSLKELYSYVNPDMYEEDFVNYYSKDITLKDMDDLTNFVYRVVKAHQTEYWGW